MPNLAIIIGNSRLRAGIFEHEKLIFDLAVPHAQLLFLVETIAQNLEQNKPDQNKPDQNKPDQENPKLQKFSKIAIASVVPNLITPWHNLPQTQILSAEMIPLTGIYASMGIDRALAGYGATTKYGCPVLVIDCGTAITLTGIDCDNGVVGGAILAGLTTQLTSLNSSTAALPLIKLPSKFPKKIPKDLPTRWAKDTATAIHSGLIYTVLAGLTDFCQDWRSLFPDSKIIFTGGDGELIFGQISNLANFKKENNDVDSQIYFDQNLIFHGITTICFAE